MAAPTKKRAGKLVAIVAAAALCFGSIGALAGCSSSDTGKQEQQAPAAQSETRTFTDSLGRTVELPATIERIVPSGHTAQAVLLTIAPDKMVGLSQELTEDQKRFIDIDTENMPVLGAAFGAKGDFNKEAAASVDPQVIIDTGEVKDGMTEDLDTLQEQTGIPVVFVETKLGDYASAYTMLGEILGLEERAKVLSDYCKNAYDETTSVMASIPESERVNLAYLLGDAGLNAIAKNSYQGQVIDMCANNVVVVEKASGSGMGQEISLEQLAVWNPELIIFGSTSGSGTYYSAVADDAGWAGIAAIENGAYYEVPLEPLNWLNNPPTVNQVMGMQWLPRLLYPDKFDTSIADVTKSYFKTFYNYDLSDAEVAEITANATPKTK